MKTIPLTHGKKALVDDEDFLFLSQFNWRVEKRPRGEGKGCYAVKDIKRGAVWSMINMGRFILKPEPHVFVLYKNGNGLDCRKENLLLSYQTDMGKSRRRTLHNTSGYKGVCWHRGKWDSRITVLGKRIHIGSFNDKIEAGKAYDEMAVRHFGNLACINFPEDYPNENYMKA